MDKYREIQKRFEAAADGEKAVQMAAYMKDRFPFYGIQTPERKRLYRDILGAEKKKKEVDWEFLRCCFKAEHREFQYVVADYLLALHNLLEYEDISKMEDFIRTKQWWDTIDSFDRIIGDIGLRDGRVDDLMLAWSTDGDFWVRRVAIDHQLNRKEKTNPTLLEKILANNLGSDEFFINKAIGWSLRDYSKTNPDWVRGFIQKYEGRMSKLSIKEGGKYL